MNRYQAFEKQFTDTLALTRRPVSISLLDSPPAGVERYAGEEPSGCSFWRIAGAGRTFYTEAEHHYNCAIGSYTHNIDLPQPRAGELPGTLEFMTGIGYIRMEEVPGIPRLSQTPKVIVYAPLGEAPALPDVVLIAGKPARLMLVEEAAQRAGVASKLPLLARPTCMAVPAAISTGVVVSAGCIGNRVYTAVDDDDLWAAIPARALDAVANELRTIVDANETLAEYHRLRLTQISTSMAASQA